jgi:hypothetical protein
MTKDLNVFAHLMLKEIEVNPKLAEDMEYAHTRFVETLDMAAVREEIRARQFSL